MTWIRPGLLVLAVACLVAVPVAQAHDLATSHEEPVPHAASPLWVVTLVASIVMAVTFAAIALFLWRALIRDRQWGSNPLLVGITLIFTTCAVSHGLHAEHLLLPFYAPLLGLPGWQEAVSFGLHSQVAMAYPALMVMDVGSATAAIWYYATRQRHADAFEGAELAEDIELLEDEARAMQDTVVQTTTEALLHMDLDQDDDALEDIERAMDEAKGIVSQFLGEGLGRRVRPGDLKIIDDPGSKV